MKRHCSRYIPVLALAMIQLNCGGSDPAPSTPTYSATQASGVISGVGAGVVGSGTGAGKTAMGGNAIAMMKPSILDFVMQRAFASGEGVDGRCDSHGYALVSGTSTRMNNGQADYAAMNLFCKLAKNTYDPDSVQGTYSMLKGIACALENAGMTFDNTAHNITMTIDTKCFTAAQVTNMTGGGGVASTMTVSATAAKPAPFNSYYDAGAVITVPNFGIFKIGAKVKGSKIEFIGAEDQSSITPNKFGAYGGSFDTSTGVLSFETRSDRFTALQNGTGSCGSSCGFGRHMRLFAKLTLDSSGNPTGISHVETALANIGRSDDSYTSTYAEVLTASGDMATGIKTRLYNYTGSGAGSVTNLNTASSYSEVSAAEGCYTSASNSASGCGTGITIGSGSVPFVMATSYTSPLTWAAGLTSGINFTTVTLADVQ